MENENTRSRAKRKDIFYVPIAEIEIEVGFNPRTNFGDINALAKSIEENGVKNALRGFKDKNGKYIVTDGERRFRAASIVAEKSPEILIPFIIDISNKSAEQRIIDTIICNDGLKFNPLEEAEVVNRLINYGMSEHDIAKRTGLSGAYVSNLKLLYNAPQKLKNLIAENVVSSTLAMQVLRNAPSYDEAVEIIEKGLVFNNSADGGEKKKLVKRDLEKSQGKINSYSEVKKCVKTALKTNKVVKQEKIELFVFVQQIINGELSKEQFNEIFFED